MCPRPGLAQCAHNDINNQHAMMVLRNERGASEKAVVSPSLCHSEAHKYHRWYQHICPLGWP